MLGQKSVKNLGRILGKWGFKKNCFWDLLTFNLYINCHNLKYGSIITEIVILRGSEGVRWSHFLHTRRSFPGKKQIHNRIKSILMLYLHFKKHSNSTPNFWKWKPITQIPKNTIKTSNLTLTFGNESTIKTSNLTQIFGNESTWNLNSNFLLTRQSFPGKKQILNWIKSLLMLHLHFWTFHQDMVFP